MYMYEKDDKLCVVLGEEGKKQIPVENPDVVIEKDENGVVKIQVGEVIIPEVAEDDASQENPEEIPTEPEVPSENEEEVPKEEEVEG